MSPCLRFKGFDTAWRTTSFKEELIEYKLGGNYANSEKLTGFPLIKMGNLGRGDMNLRKVEYIEEGETIDPNDEMRDGDLFFNTRNTLELVGKVAIWRSELARAYYNSNLMRITFACNQFMNYRLNSIDGVEALRRLATGTTSVAAIYTRDLLQMEITIPSLPEQRKIADFLTAVDGRIAQLSQKKALLMVYKKGVMQQLFTQALRFQDDRGNDFPDWEVKPLADVANLISGQHLGPEQYDDDPDGVPYFTGPSDYTNDPAQITKWTKLSTKIAPPESVLITVKGNGVGTLMYSILPQVAMGRQLMAIRSEKHDSFFLYQFLLTKSQDFVALGSGNLIPGLSRPDILSMPMPVPSLPEQTKIARFLAALDHKIEAVNAQVSYTQTWKKGLLQRMFI